MPATKLTVHRVEKPWGRTRLCNGFRDQDAEKAPIGEIWFQEPGDRTPDLLVKYLFTEEKLSVQVHPNDDQAHARGLSRGKDECWLVLHAEPDATIALGTTRPLSRCELRAAALNGSIENLLHWHPVKTGDFFYVPSNTIHAIGAGITLIEIQQNSDTTYRLYDYGRARELHLDDGVEVSDPVPYQPLPPPEEIEAGRSLLVEGPKFVLERWRGCSRDIHLPPDHIGWLVPICGKGKVDGIAWETGDCISIDGDERITASEDADILIAYSGSSHF